MPKIEVNESLFFKLLGAKLEAKLGAKHNYDYDKLEEILTSAKAELDEKPDTALPEKERIIKIELNDTNRPDLWSTAGLARLLRIHAGGTSNTKSYQSFLSSKEKMQDSADRTVKVSPELKDIRPFAAGFVISGKPIDELMLADIIQTQEKLCRNFGRKRKTFSMGVYRSKLIKWPVEYTAVDPDKTEFTPLGMEKPLLCRKILKEHPKGIEYASLLEGKKFFPILKDANGEVLSMPPVINSAKIGAVQAGDTDLFVEFTGTDMTSILLSANIVACDFADCGYKILPVKIEHPYETGYGKILTTPFYFQENAETSVEAVNKLLGSSFKAEEIAEALKLMDSETQISGNKIMLKPSPYRNDFLHEVDIIEDVMMGKTVNFFTPEKPNEFTIGRLLPATLLSRKIKGLMTGMGYQEMIFNYLGSKKDYIERMCIDEDSVIEISNPMSENYQFVRNSILPSLLNAEMGSANAAYPHKIFETGKIAFFDKTDATGTRTAQSLGFLTAEQNANFNTAASEAANLLYYLGIEYKVCETVDPRFIQGRQAGLLYNGEQIGIFGEVNPKVLENWDINIPCFAGELNIEKILKTQN
ncbi:phenylalanine--tRNA ligase subunit beta [Treponema putidum]|uniref:phenylalanine--tRNA ligase subunit beta n=1 Tax=Treponema putidum TaxID=221027 RepID=UPI0004F5BBD4|nr:phenylalanine--tRNA ligase subunit beta [Treponema putidum]AIN94863.1 phenylalanyl-tRNA synthetase subunit beta [Treponema putidum]TWI77145.1 phenylalanyl-tRNA synthetase beta subunit [Treponema putidum]